jgi:O-antigen ligase
MARVNFDPANREIQKSLFLASLVTLAVSPTINHDPINLIKLLTLTIMGGYFMPHFVKFIFFKSSISHKSKSDRWIVGSIRFLLPLTIVLKLLSDVINRENILQQIFGGFGRNSGLLAYIALIIIFGSATSLVLKVGLSKAVIRPLIWLSVILVSYGFLQILNLDPVDWRVIYNPVMVTLGNPNFAASILGMLFCFLFPQALSVEIKVRQRYLLIALCISITFVVFNAEAFQGLILICIGFFGSILIKIWYTVKGNRWVILVLALFTIPIFIMILGFFGNGPLGSTLRQQTLLIRVEYWRTAIAMSRDNFLFGLGSSAFGDYFRFYRDKRTIELIGPNVTTSSAHNVLLDHLSSSGVLVFIIILSIQLLVLCVAIRRLLVNAHFDSLFVGLFLLYLAYFAQSLISIDNLGLAVWGWLAGGLVLGGALQRDVEFKQYEKKDNHQPIFGSLTAVFALLIIVPYFSADTRFVSALKSGDLISVQEAATQWMSDEEKFRFTIELFKNQGFESEAESLSDDALSRFPNSYILVSQRLSFFTLDPEERSQLTSRLKTIDPLYQGN